MGMRWVLVLALALASCLWGEVLLPGPITPDMKLPEANRARVTDGALHLDTQGTVTWRFAVKPQWKKIRVLADFRVQSLKLGKETWQNARVMVRFDEKDGRNNEFGKQWYGGAPSLSTDSDWQTQETVSDVPAGAGYLCVVPAVFAQAGTMDLRRLEIEALDETQTRAAVVKAFLAPLPEAPNGPAINGGFEDGQKPWTGWGDSTTIASEGANHFLRASRKELGWANLTSVYRLPANVRAIRVSAKVRVADPKQGPEGWQWPRIFVTPLSETGEHVGGWPNMTFQSDFPWSHRSFIAEFPADARAFRLEVGLFNSAGTMDVDDIRFEYLSPGGAPISLPKEYEPARDAQKIVNSTSTRAEMVLNGLWRFIPAVGEAAEQPKGDWGWMWVPGSWKTTDRLPGLAAGGLSGPWAAFEPDTNARGWYEHRFNVPQEWAGRTVMLDLERVSTDATIWCNGVECGKVNWPGGQVDLTKAIKPGENVLRLLVVSVLTEKESASLMGVGAGQVTKTESKLDTRGIIGDVRLLAYPAAAHISDVFVKTSTRKKQVTLDVELAGLSKAGGIHFVATMLDERGKPEQVFEGKTQAAAADLQHVEVTFDWKNPRLWDLDQPNLYTLKLAAFGPGLRDEYLQRFGFREFWIGADDGKPAGEQGVLPNRLKFFLNGTEFRMRPNCWDDSYELKHSMREGAEAFIRSFRYVGFNIAEIWPTRKTERGIINAREVWATAADELGMPLLGAGPESTPFIINFANWSYTWDARKADYQRYAAAEVRKLRNHPSILAYSTNANFFGHNQDQNPRYIGRTNWTINEDKVYRRNQTAGRESLQYIKSLDPTRPVFTHMGGQEFGDISATNHYLCFIPLQEREEWMSYWAQQGGLPYIAIEFGTPLSCSFMRGHAHGGWGQPEPGGAMTSEPLVTEFSAIYLGEKAYQQESPQYRALIPTYFMGNQLYRGLHVDPLVTSSNLQDIELLFMRNTWRSYRTQGFSSLVPWELAHGWQGIRDSGERIAMPPFQPGRLGAYFPSLSKSQMFRLQPEGGKAQPAAGAVITACSDTMAWIAGPERLDYPTSEVPASTNAPAAKGPPAFMSKDHNYYAGETLKKQIVMINDSRTEQPFSVSYSVRVGDKAISQQSDGSIKPSQTLFTPMELKLPDNIAQKQAGTIKLVAHVGKTRHEDEFTFTVFPRPSKGAASVLAFDPQGQTSAALKTLGYDLANWDGAATQKLLVIGRKAMSAGQLPGDLEKFVAAGGNAIIMAQDPQWMRDYWGLRVNQQASRRVYPIASAHELFSGIDAQDLRDWRGEGTLVDPYTPTADLIKEAGYGWKWGNRGTVSSAAIEKPHNSGWTPLLQCEFDMAYSPLMELRFGAGKVVLCTLDIEGRTCADPVADLILSRLIRAYSAPAAVKAGASHIGGGTELLLALGVNGLKTSNPQCIIAGEGADMAAIRQAATEGRTVVMLPRTSASGRYPVELVKAAFPNCDVPNWPMLRGIAMSDLHWRTPADAWLLKPAAGIEIAADGQLGLEKVGKGQIIYCQLDPNRFDADTKTYFRFTRWRQTRALAQILANAGASFEMDSRIFHPEKPEAKFVDLSGEWQLRITNAMAPLPNGYLPDPGLSDAAKSAIASSAGQWKTAQVPGLWENYGGEFTDLDGEVVYRKVVDIPAEFAGKPLTVNLGPIDDFDDTFWDGKLIGRTDIKVPQFYAIPRQYKLTPQQTSSGQHVLAVRIFDHKGGGGFGGQKSQMALTPPQVIKKGFYHPDYRADHDLGDDPASYKRW